MSQKLSAKSVLPWKNFIISKIELVQTLPSSNSSAQEYSQTIKFIIFIFQGITYTGVFDADFVKKKLCM